MLLSFKASSNSRWRISSSIVLRTGIGVDSMNEAAFKSELSSHSSSLCIEACCRLTEAAGVPRVEPLLDEGLSSSDGSGTFPAAVAQSSC